MPESSPGNLQALKDRLIAILSGLAPTGSLGVGLPMDYTSPTAAGMKRPELTTQDLVKGGLEAVSTATPRGVEELSPAAIFGLPRSRRFQFHGTTYRDARGAIAEGLKAGKHVEQGIPGLSTTKDPGVADFYAMTKQGLTGHSGSGAVLAVEVPPELLQRTRNLRPSEYLSADFDAPLDAPLSIPIHGPREVLFPPETLGQLKKPQRIDKSTPVKRRAGRPTSLARDWEEIAYAVRYGNEGSIGDMLYITKQTKDPNLKALHTELSKYQEDLKALQSTRDNLEASSLVDAEDVAVVDEQARAVSHRRTTILEALRRGSSK